MISILNFSDKIIVKECPREELGVLLNFDFLFKMKYFELILVEWITVTQGCRAHNSPGFYKHVTDFIEETSSWMHACQIERETRGTVGVLG